MGVMLFGKRASAAQIGMSQAKESKFPHTGIFGA
jgi:hypothetical protein